LRTLPEQTEIALNILYELQDALNNPESNPVQIVRCKDCKNWSEAMLKCYRELDDEHSFHGAPDIWQPNDFCSYGEKGNQS